MKTPEAIMNLVGCVWLMFLFLFGVLLCIWIALLSIRDELRRAREERGQK